MEKVNLPNRYDYISAFLTFRCNLDCGFCVNKSSNDSFQRNAYKEISGREWVNILNNIKSKKNIPVSLVGGEPSLHKDFIYIINNLDQRLGIDIVTNLWWSNDKINEFINKVSPDRINNHSPFPSIRASYHPEQMNEGEKLINNAKRLKSAGFDIGIEGIMYPTPFQLESLERMSIRCRENEISFRPKSFIGIYEGVDDYGKQFSITHGDYSKYPGSVFNKETHECMCKTSNLYISPSADIYRCQRDLLLMENPKGNILDSDFRLEKGFKKCNNYGQCHPCDVKVKTDSKQRLGTTLVEIKNIK
jgi:MoaA/NifB/PqqE/SkfB family radical SAM enzyme